MSEVFDRLRKVADAYPSGSHHMVVDVEDIRLALHLHEGAERRIQLLEETREADFGQGVKMRMALEFYAAKETWQVNGHPQVDADTKPIVRDGGKVARDALKGGL
ncbi:hypothetical protein [Thalassospira sp.]|uniref:hypothetical protein n=1 Tax=Thalassospira sp. TaxID=1912094 RepID=UPI000C3ED941|nr:hypothetical protein [Thalassospira sp.]MBC05706.1 hypothetical protein [Thalassospira sp.]|tara:strand:- start:1873 stop:2187 length:315 start_codon:yes stop_codon:yes gene_type:complete